MLNKQTKHNEHAVRDNFELAALVSLRAYKADDQCNSTISSEGPAGLPERGIPVGRMCSLVKNEPTNQSTFVCELYTHTDQAESTRTL